MGSFNVKVFLGFFLLSLSGFALKADKFSSGAFVSGGLGWISGNSGMPVVKFVTDPRVYITNDSLKKLKSSGVTGEIALGYTYFRRSFGLEGDFFCNFSSLKSRQSQIIGLNWDNPPGTQNHIDLKSDFSLQKKEGFGLRLRPGIRLGKSQRFFVHATMGVDYSRFIFRNEIEDTEMEGVSHTLRKQKKVFGMIFGAGVMAKLSPSLSAGLECTQTAYHKMTYDFIINPRLDDGTCGYITCKPSMTQVMLKVAYHFGGKKGIAS